jgi:hypothetical protein
VRISGVFGVWKTEVACEGSERQAPPLLKRESGW